MSLSDIDKMRDDTKKKEEIIKTLKAELAKEKADRRIVKITKNYPTSNNVVYDIISKVRSLLKSNLYKLGIDAKSMYKFEGRLDQLLYSYSINLYTPTGTDVINEVKEYINFEDVQADIRQQAEDAVSQEIGTLKYKVSTQVQKLAELSKEYEDEIIARTKNHHSEIESYESRIQDLQNKYDDLLNERETKTREKQLEEKIKDLEEKLQKETSKSWISKLIK
jgi:chemotaxis protein histidine kinase CheA